MRGCFSARLHIDGELSAEREGAAGWWRGHGEGRPALAGGRGRPRQVGPTCQRSWERGKGGVGRQCLMGRKVLTVYFGTPSMFITLWFGFDYGTNPPLGTLII
jgi:hypothetical protein